jgi:hypothetical protein
MASAPAHSCRRKSASTTRLASMSRASALRSPSGSLETSTTRSTGAYCASSFRSAAASGSFAVEGVAGAAEAEAARRRARATNGVRMAGESNSIRA